MRATCAKPASPLAENAFSPNQRGKLGKAIKRLEDHGLIYEMDGEHRFGDSFFRQWILGSV
jgi:hypothetical protein